jgi:hypothetical protein
VAVLLEAASDPSGLTVGHNSRVKVDPVLMTVALGWSPASMACGDSGALWPAAILPYLPAAIVHWRWPRCPTIACARSCVEGGGRMCSTKAFIQLATATCPGLNRPSCLTVKHDESSTPHPHLKGVI